MNITLPARRTYAKVPFLLALVGTFALAAVVALATDGAGGKERSPRVSPFTSIGTQATEPAASLTFILVGSAEEADYLSSLRADGEFLLDSNASQHEVVILTVGTSEQEASAMATIKEASDASMRAGLIPIHVVDARDADILPR